MCPRCAVAQGLRRTHIRLSGAIRPERPRWRHLCRPVRTFGEVAHYFQSCWASLGYRYRYAYSNYYLPAVRCSGAVDCCNVLCSGRPLSRRHGLLMDVSRRRVLPSTNIITQGAHRMNDARGRVCSQGIRSPGIAARRAASGTWQQHMAHPAGLGFMITGCNRSPTFPVLVAVPLSCFCSCSCFCS